MKFFCQTIRKFIIAWCVLFLFPVDALATTYQVTQVATGLGIPWGMAFLPKGDILITDRGGKIFRVKEDGRKYEITGGPLAHSEGQGGLLDI